MPLDATSIAAAVGSTVENVQFQTAANNVPRKQLIVATYDPLKTLVVNSKPVQVLSAEDAGSRFGFGFPAHRLAKKAFIGNNGIPTYVSPQAEVAGAKAAGSITPSGAVTAAGTIHLYIAGDYTPVAVAAGDVVADIGAAIEAAINAKQDLPITAVDTLGVVATAAKDTSTYGNDVKITLNEGLLQELPLGIDIVIVDPVGGTGVPDLSGAALSIMLGYGDAANEDNYTGIVHSFGKDTPTMDAFSLYNGIGNDFIGLYAKTIGRPFRVLTGDTNDTNGLVAAKAIGDARKLDRTNGMISVPYSPSHPAEIAAVAMGVMEKTNNNRAAEPYIGKSLPTIIPGPNVSDRWTNDWNNRESALRSGISPTIVKNNAVILQNVATFYHPDNVPVESNVYRSQRNLSIIQNVLFNNRLNFELEKWLSIIIVADIAKVTNAIDRQKARDRGAVIDDLLALAVEYEGHGWIFSASFTIEQFQSNPLLVTLRPGGTGFNVFMPLVLSGEGGIFDTIAQVDTSLAVFLN